MKKILFTVCLFFTSSSLFAGEDVIYKCMSPCDVFKGVGCYLKDAGCRVGYGVETIITAPFKAKACFPEPTEYKYTPPSFEFDYTPPGWERLGKPEQEGTIRLLHFTY
jgi:hypothetical protein